MAADRTAGLQASPVLEIRAIGGVTLTEEFSIGAGARYWNIRTVNAAVHFEAIDGVAAGGHIENATMGAFLQASYQIGRLRPSTF